MYAVFLLGALAFGRSFRLAHPAMALVALVAIVVPGIAWGAMLNGYLLLARDASAYVSFLQPPLAFLGGVRMPVSLLPLPCKKSRLCCRCTGR